MLPNAENATPSSTHYAPLNFYQVSRRPNATQQNNSIPALQNLSNLFAKIQYSSALHMEHAQLILLDCALVVHILDLQTPRRCI